MLGREGGPDGTAECGAATPGDGVGDKKGDVGLQALSVRSLPGMTGRAVAGEGFQGSREKGPQWGSGTPSETVWPGSWKQEP